MCDVNGKATSATATAHEFHTPSASPLEFKLRHREDVHFYIIPCVFIGIFAFLIAHCMLSLYEMVVDTLFLCVCEDRIINGPNGRWRESNLAHLVGEEPVEEVVMQTVELTPITKQPFSHHA